MAWRGLTTVLLNGLRDRGPAAKPLTEENKLQLAFGVHGDSEPAAMEEARASLLEVIGSDENAMAALRHISVMDSEVLDRRLKEIEAEKPQGPRVFSKYEISSLIPRTVEYDTPAPVIDLRNEKD